MGQRIQIVGLGFLFWIVALVPYATFSYSVMGIKNFEEKIGSQIIAVDPSNAIRKKVVVSDWLTLNPEDWSMIAPSQMSYSIQITELTQTNYQQGIVLVYHRASSTKSLPLVSLRGLEMHYGSAVDILWIEAVHQTGQRIDSLKDHNFRYILIPQEKMDAKNLSKRKIKNMAYTEVVAAFHIVG